MVDPVRDGAGFSLLQVLDEDEHKQVGAYVWHQLPAWKYAYTSSSRKIPT
jgi:hypothetical protein